MWDSLLAFMKSSMARVIGEICSFYMDGETIEEGNYSTFKKQ